MIKQNWDIPNSERSFYYFQLQTVRRMELMRSYIFDNTIQDTKELMDLTK